MLFPTNQSRSFDPIAVHSSFLYKHAVQYKVSFAVHFNGRINNFFVEGWTLHFFVRDI